MALGLIIIKRKLLAAETKTKMENKIERNRDF